MTVGDRPRGSLGEFASQAAGLGVDLTEAETPAAIFRKLRELDYLPDPLRQEAMFSLVGRPVESESLLRSEAAASEECRIHGEIERFASGFFDLPRAERVERWRVLARSAENHPRLIERLRALKPGLGVDRVADPSPVVGRILDDLITLFPMPIAARSVESRARVERLSSDPSLSPGDRTRAIGRVQKRYPNLAALSHGYLLQLGQASLPRKKPASIRARTPVGLHSNVEHRPIVYVFLILSLAGGLIRLMGESRRTNQPTIPKATQIPRRPTSTANPPTDFGPAVLPLNPDRDRPFLPNLPASNFKLQIRDKLKDKLKVDLARLGKALRPKEIVKVINQLPTEELPPIDDLVGLGRLREWTEERRGRFVAGLKEGLKSVGLDLGEAELDDFANGFFPPAATGPARISPDVKSP